MSEPYISLLSGMIGAVIGSLSSIVGIYVQSKLQREKDKNEIIFKGAMEQYKLTFDIVIKTGGGETIPPLANYVHYQKRVFEILEKDKLDENALKEILLEQQRISKSFNV